MQQRAIGVVLMILRIKQSFAGLLEELGEALLRLQMTADGQEIHPMANQRAAVFKLCLPRNGDADDHIFLLREAMNQERETGE